VVHLIRTAGIALLLTFSLTLLGCPGAPTIGDGETVALIVEPSTLEFGATEAEMSFQVKRNYGGGSAALFRAIATETWISVNPASGATSGPQDAVAITVAVDRSLLGAGNNSGVVRITSEGASDKFVRVNAFRRLAPTSPPTNYNPSKARPSSFRTFPELSATAPLPDGRGTSATGQRARSRPHRMPTRPQVPST